MRFEIYEGRNQGYPYIPELSERDSAGLISPVSRTILIADGSGYPMIAGMPAATVELIKPLPGNIMICCGDDVNGGLPWISRLKAIITVTESSLYFGDKKVTGLYLGEKEIKTAFCNNKKVFDIYFDRKIIV